MFLVDEYTSGQVVVAQRVHVVSVVLVRDLFVGDVGDEIVEMFVPIRCGERREHGVRGGGSRGWLWSVGRGRRRSGNEETSNGKKGNGTVILRFGVSLE